MVIWKWGRGFARSIGPGALACAVGVSSCSDGYEPGAPSLGSGTSGAAEAGAAPGVVAPGIGGSFGTEPTCVDPETRSPIYADEMFDRVRPWRGELYSWTTDEQAAELRRDGVLFSRSEAAGLGPGYAFLYLDELAQSSVDPLQAKLAKILTGPLFAKKRYAWPAPWATRMGWPGEDYGASLLRIVLKPEAWLVVVDGGELRAIDQSNLPVDIGVVIANPERIGAIFHNRSGADGGPGCGTFNSGQNGYREYVLGNLAMVEEWSLGTLEIRDRLASDIDRLTRLLPLIRTCPVSGSPAQWNAGVTCSWLADPTLPLSERLAYERSLALPSENYVPAPKQLANMIETLQGDLFELDPFVVKPGSP